VSTGTETSRWGREKTKTARKGTQEKRDETESKTKERQAYSFFLCEGVVGGLEGLHRRRVELVVNTLEIGQNFGRRILVRGEH
jgi:hypothetical protein